ncbi:MAG: urease accessory protein UreF [Burkholderiales bacterium]
MHSAEQLLAALQHADSFFPAGGIAFSWGVETLVSDGCIGSPEDLAESLSGQIEQRWNHLDRVFLAQAYRCSDDPRALSVLDQELEAMLLARESREGSRRAGTSLLLVHEKIGTPGAAHYRALVNNAQALGHLPIVQALVWKAVGMAQATVESVAAYAMCVGMIGASLRLGVIGHLAGQRIMTDLRPRMAKMLEKPAPSIAQAQSFAPGAEIAMMRHEVQASRLFAN